MRPLLTLFFLVILLALAALAVYLVLKPKAALKLVVPQLESVGGVYTRLVGDTAHTELLLEVNNSSWLAVQLDSVVYRVSLDTALVLAGAQSFKTKVQRGKRDTLSLYLPFAYKRVSEKIRSSQHRDSLPLELSLRLVYTTVFGRASLPFKKSTAVEVPLPPRLEIERIEYLGRKGRKLKLNALLLFHNYGKVYVKVHDLRYETQVGHTLTVRGGLPQSLNVLPQKQLRFSLPLEVELRSPAKALWRVMFNRRQIDYHLKVTAQVSQGDHRAMAVPVRIEKSGRFEFKK